MAADGNRRAGLSGATTEPTVDPRWLAARVAPDTAARAVTVNTLLPQLINFLIDSGGDESDLEIIDLGAGTGANQRWLAPRLPFRQRWIHLDHDPAISRSLSLSDHTVIIDDGVEALAGLLADRSGGPRLVTCSALLDVLTMTQIYHVCRAVIDNRVPALFSLTVTGMLSVTPTHPDDQLLLAAFNDHQRRAGRAGPDATSVASNALREGGFHVLCQETPWQLSAASGQAFVEQVLQERLEAAVAYHPTLAATAAAWLELRGIQFALGILQIDLGHCDILALPGGP
jgi:hypothetical protein